MGPPFLYLLPGDADTADPSASLRSQSVGLILSAVSFLSSDLTRDTYDNCSGLILDFLGSRSLLSLTVQLKCVASEMEKKQREMGSNDCGSKL